ncbi:oligosaccharide flippase family protein [Mesotoga sp. UBA5825]|uniref:oligosaccharide flippase family protein n=1 Tax=Mesotoga sp. UBA5825 TaxID=1946858 RepID=UPI0025E2E4E7|nr:oligosaccharide flippase family protein [Mesotoga sp. UBA5825]
MGIVRDAGYVLVSNIITIAVTFLYYPLLVKFYGFPSEVFGSFQYIQSTLGVIASFSVIAMDTAYVSEGKVHSEQERAKFATWFLLIGIIIKSSSILFWAFLTKDISFAVLGLIIGFPQMLSIMVQLVLRDQKDFKLLSTVIILQSATNVATGLLIGFFVRNEASLVLASSMSFLVSSGYVILKSKIGLRFSKPDRSFLRGFLRDNSNLVIFQTGSSVLNTFSFNLPVFILRVLFDDVILGFYSLAYRLILAVNRVMSQALAQTFLPYFSKSRDDELRIFGWFPVLALGFYPIYLLVSLFSDWYIPILFTQEFGEVGKIIKILIPWQYTVAVISPYTSSFLVHKKANVGLWINILLLGARIGSLVLGASFGHRMALLFFSMISTLFFNIMMIYSFKYAVVRCNRDVSMIILLQISMYLAVLDNVFRWISILPCVILIYSVFSKRDSFKQIMMSIKRKRT